MIKKITNILNNSKQIPVKGILLSTIGCLIIVLAFYNSRDAMFGVPLEITTTNDGATLTEQFLPISGFAKHAKELQINGRDVAFDRDGNFRDGVLLSPGYNIVEISLKDQFGNQKSKTYHLVLDKPPAVAQVIESTDNNYQ